jgi:O-antigen/teichoic acid export membrane protein
MTRGVPVNFVLIGCGQALAMLFHVSAARALGVSGYGSFSYAHSNAMLLATIVSLGWPLASMRFVAQYRERREWAHLRGILAQGQYIVLSLSIGASAVLLAAAWLLRSRPEGARAAVLMAVLTPLFALTMLRGRQLRGLMQVTASIVFGTVAVPALALAGVFAFRIDTVVGLVTVFAFTALSVRVVETGYLYRVMPSGARSAQSQYDLRLWSRVAIVLALGELGRTVVFRADVFLLASLAGTEHVGIYSGVRRACVPITFTLVAVNTIAGPLLGSAYHGGRRADFIALLRRAALWSLAGALPPFSVAMFAPAWLMSWFGEGFVAGTAVLRVAACGALVNAATGPVTMALVLAGRERQHTTAMSIAAIVSVAANVVVIPRWGALGAAWVAASVVGGLNCWLFILARRVAPSVGDDT